LWSSSNLRLQRHTVEVLHHKCPASFWHHTIHRIQRTGITGLGGCFGEPVAFVEFRCSLPVLRFQRGGYFRAGHSACRRQQQPRRRRGLFSEPACVCVFAARQTRYDIHHTSYIHTRHSWTTTNVGSKLVRRSNKYAGKPQTNNKRSFVCSFVVVVVVVRKKRTTTANVTVAAAAD